MQLVEGALLLEVRYMLGALQQRLRGHAHYRRLQRTLTHSFPDAAAGRLAGEVCPICLDDMQSGKQLPCSHCAHASCLLAWLQQQSSCSGGGSRFTCPLCRANLDVHPPPTKQHGLLHSVALVARSLLLAAAELLAAAAQPPPRPASLPASRSMAVRPSRQQGDARTAPAPADRGAAMAAPEPALGGSSEGCGPTRRITRSQARLAASQASAAAPQHCGPSRQRRRIDGMLD